MKISAMPAGMGGQPGVDLAGINVGRTADPQKMAAAKAIAAGEQPIRVNPSDTPTDSQVKRIQDVRKIKMKTNVSPEQYDVAPDATTQSAISVPTEQANALEDTRPLSPQFAALAKQRRALQIKERELADRERAIQSNPVTDGGSELIARLKSQPLSVLQEHGVTYDQLTEAILNNGSNSEVKALEARLKAIEEGVDKRFQTQEERQEEAALTEMLYEAENLAKEGEAYELIRDRNAYDQVLRLIHSTYKKTGRVMEVTQAMDKVEAQILDRDLKIANTNKIRSRLFADQPLQTQPTQRTMRTLTSRDGAAAPLDRKSRAMAAFRGMKG
jgi:hypothetical protein